MKLRVFTKFYLFGLFCLLCNALNVVVCSNKAQQLIYKTINSTSKIMGKIYSEYDPNITIIRKNSAPRCEDRKGKLSNDDKAVFQEINNMYGNGVVGRIVGIGKHGILQFCKNITKYKCSIEKIYNILDNAKYVEQLLQEIENELQKKLILERTENNFKNAFKAQIQDKKCFVNCGDSNKFYKIFLLAAARAKVKSAKKSHDSGGYNVFYQDLKQQVVEYKNNRELQVLCVTLIKKWREKNSIQQDASLTIKQRKTEMNYVVSNTISQNKTYNRVGLQHMYNNSFSNKTLNEISEEYLQSTQCHTPQQCNVLDSASTNQVSELSNQLSNVNTPESQHHDCVHADIADNSIGITPQPIQSTQQVDEIINQLQQILYVGDSSNTTSFTDSVVQPATNYQTIQGQYQLIQFDEENLAISTIDTEIRNALREQMELKKALLQQITKENITLKSVIDSGSINYNALMMQPK